MSKLEVVRNSFPNQENILNTARFNEYIYHYFSKSTQSPINQGYFAC